MKGFLDFFSGTILVMLLVVGFFSAEVPIFFGCIAFSILVLFLWFCARAIIRHHGLDDSDDSIDE